MQNSGVLDLRDTDLREYGVNNVLLAWHGNIQIGAIFPVFVHLLLTRVCNASATARRPRLLKDDAAIALSHRCAPCPAQRVIDASSTTTLQPLQSSHIQWGYPTYFYVSLFSVRYRFTEGSVRPRE